MRWREALTRYAWTPIGLAVLLGLGSWTAGPSPSPGIPPPDPALQLLSGGVVHGRLAGGQRRRFPLPLRAGSYLRLEVQQRGVDLILRLRAPGGALLAETDGWNGGWGAERISLVAGQTGVHVLELVPTYRAAAAGPFSVAAAERRMASARDRLRVESDRAAARGRALLFGGQAEPFEAAATSFRKALELALAARDSSAELDARLGLAATAIDAGQFGEAIAELDETMPLAQAIGAGTEAEALRMRAVALQEAGDPHRALDDLVRALPLWHRVPYSRRERAQHLLTLTNAYSQLGDRRQAGHHATLALTEARRLGDPWELAVALVTYGSVKSLLDDPEGALAPLEEALALSIGAGFPRPTGESEVRVSLGAALRRLDRDLEAQAVLERALALAREERSAPLQASALLQLAATCRGAAQRDRQRALLEESLRLWQEIGHLGGRAASLAMLGRLDLEEGHVDRAIRRIEESLDIREAQWRWAPSPNLQAASFASHFNVNELYVELLVRSQQSGRNPRGIELAFAAVERARARGLQRQLLQARYENESGLPRELLERRRDLGREMLARVAGPLPWVPVASETEDLPAELEKVERRISDLNPRYAALMLPEPVELAEVQRLLLDEGTVLLAYALGEHRSFVWVVSHRSVRVVELPARARIEATVRAVTSLIAARNESPRFETAAERRERLRHADVRLAPAARLLTRTILDPLAHEIQGKRLAIVADGALHHVPWLALPEPALAAGSPQPGKPLGTSHEIVLLPSATALRDLRAAAASRPPAERVLAVVADPVLDAGDPRLGRPSWRDSESRTAMTTRGRLSGAVPPDREAYWPPLPHAREEADAILALVPPWQRLVALDFAASRELLSGPELGRNRIVHLATHANIDDGEPELSGIVLSMVEPDGRPREGVVSLFDLYRMHLPSVELVVLSGCRTALGPELKGEGLVGVARAFMFAGAPRVVVSLWDVDDRATAELMKRFYTFLLHDGKPPAAALRAAQLAMASSAEWREPYYWAGFVLQGDWQ